MKRLSILLPIAIVLAACAETPPEPSRVMRVSAALQAPAGEAVEVVVFDIPPGRRIEAVALLDAGGSRHAAPALAPAVRESGPGSASNPLIGLGVRGGSSSGVKPSLSLGWNMTAGDDPGRRSRRVTARIPIPDAGVYRENARNWRIEVIFLDVTGERRSLSFPMRTP
jgi:hypothetical protein